jgi:CheY-like chemotaxis protein
MDKIKSVLIVDDDRDDVELFCEAVQEIDETINCLRAMEGEQALKMLRNNKSGLPDMIFLDLNMPRMGGRQFLHEIKKNRGLNDIPVFIYTTSRSEEDKRETKKLGAAGFITKPTNYKDIHRVLSDILDTTNGRQRN